MKSPNNADKSWDILQKHFKHFCIIMILPVFFIVLYYYPYKHGIHFIQPADIRDSISSLSKMAGKYTKGIISYQDVENRTLNFDPNDNKIIIILHIQKTGGTWFESTLVRTLNTTPRCLCPQKGRNCKCLNNHGHIWLVSGQFSIKWPCGLHADWTELTECINGFFEKREGIHRKRRYLYVTQLREPIQRYVSEWKNVQRGATWRRNGNKAIQCDGRKITELLGCKFPLKNVSLDKFIDCPHNLAINRQTRMLANLSLVNCYNTSAIPKRERNRIMLQSAKNNVRDMVYFGLTEYQKLNQRLFEYTFGVTFTKNFSQSNKTYAEKAKNHISSSQLEKIKELNHLDIELYKYAKELYFQRLEKGNLLALTGS